MRGPCCRQSLRAPTCRCQAGSCRFTHQMRALRLDGPKKALVVKLASFRFRSAINLLARSSRENRFLDLPDDSPIDPQGLDCLRQRSRARELYRKS